MTQLRRQLEIPLVIFLFLSGAAFLLKMCYLSLAFNTGFGIGFLAAVYAYARGRFGLRIPVALLALVFLAMEVDALGNYYRMYGQKFGPIQYDEFSHMTVQALITPVIVWLMMGVMGHLNYKLSVRLTTFFAATTMFSLSAFYELIELWDELYFQGQRIWNKHDTATDLQWDLCGIVIGSLLANVVLGLREMRRKDKVDLSPVY